MKIDRIKNSMGDFYDYSLMEGNKELWERLHEYSTIKLGLDEMGYVVYKKVDSLELDEILCKIKKYSLGYCKQKI